MGLNDKRAEAEKLYVRQSLSCNAIAKQLGMNEGTVYCWKQEAAERGENSSWETQRRVYNMSPKELIAIYSETVKAWIVQLKKNPELLADTKIADVVSKHIAALQKIDKRGQYLGVVTDLIKVINEYLAANAPELKERLAPFWDGIYNAMVAYSTDKGVL